MIPLLKLTAYLVATYVVVRLLQIPVEHSKDPPLGLLWTLSIIGLIVAVVLLVKIAGVSA